MPFASYLARCPCFWPRDPEGHSEDYGYLVPDAGDVVHVVFEGSAAGPGEERGWLYGFLLVRAPGSPHPPIDDDLPSPVGWLPAWAVRRIHPPGPLRRRAWDGVFYSLFQWQEYYGDDDGLQLWYAASGAQAAAPVLTARPGPAASGAQAAAPAQKTRPWAAACGAQPAAPVAALPDSSEDTLRHIPCAILNYLGSSSLDWYAFVAACKMAHRWCHCRFDP